MKKFKQLISLVVVVAMIVSCFPIISYATLTDEANGQKAKISLVPMQIAEGVSAADAVYDDFTEVSATSLNLEAGDTFYVGVKLVDFDHITGMSDGLTAVGAAFSFDTDYLELIEECNETNFTDYEKYFLEKTDDTIGSYILSFSGTSSRNKHTYKFDGNIGSYNSDTNNRVYCSVEYDGVSSDLAGTYYGTVDDYIGIVGFTVISKPAPGTSVFAFARTGNASQNYLNTGTTVTGTNEYQTDFTGNNTDIETVIEYDLSSIDLFPMSYDVKFYTDDTYTQAIGSGFSGILENTAIGDTDITLPEAGTDFDSPNAEGKYFSGWEYIDSSGNKHSYSELTNINADAAVDGGSEIKIYATWKDGYTVTLHSNYDSNDPNGTAEITVAPTDEVTISQDDINSALGKDGVTWDEREGYSITGWATTAGATTADFTLGTDKITGNTDLYAVWAEIIKITFNANGGTGNEKTVEINPGSGVASSDIPTYTKDRYTLKGWNTKANLGGTHYDVDLSGVIFNEAATLYAEWTPADGQESVTLTFVTDHGTAAPETVTVVKGDAVTDDMMPDDPTEADYNFKGWFKSASISDTTKIEAPITMNEDLTLYAHWDYTGDGKITVSFYQNDGVTTDAIASVDVAPNSTLGDMMPENPERDNFGFDGWNTAADGNGSEFTKDTAVTASNNDLYAQWTENITVHYNLNGGTGTIEDAVGAPTDSYSDPTDAPTKENYEFLGWNTKQNGAGAYIAAADYITYQAVADAAQSESSTVTLYAQWGDVKDPIDFTPDGPVAPSVTGVIVTFDENVGADDVNQVTSPVNPKYKYPYLGDSIGADNMPDDPERDNYTFAGWYTKPGGQGTKVDGATAITEALGAVQISDTEGYKLTLYAKWTLNDDVTAENKVTISFYENIDGNGTATPKLTDVTIFKGDSLGYTPETTATNGNFDNMGWFTVASNEDADNDEFDETAPVKADTNVFIRWKLYVDVTIDGDASSVYDGTEKELSYKIVKTDTTTEIASGKAADLTDYTFTYKKDNSPADLKDAGTYYIDVNTTDDATEKGIEVNEIQPAEYEITKALLTVKGDSATQKQPYGNASEATVNVSGYVDADYADKDAGTLKDGVAAAVKYYSWTDADANGDIQNTEIDSTAVTISNTTPIGYYVIKVEPTSNYKVSTVIGLTTYPKASDESGNPVYADGQLGENIIFQIAASDPSIAAISVYPVDENASTDTTAELPLKGSDYTTDAEFDSSEKPTVKDYYIRIDKDNKGVELDFTLTNPDTTTVTYSYGDTTNAEVTPTDGTYAIKIDELASTGKNENVITITTTSSGGDEITYTFHIQLLVAPKIELSYGNSPYGEIMKASNITDKEAAKAAFNTGNKYTSEYLPTGCSINNKYPINAWGGATDSETNMDRNDYALFIYNNESFIDPGFTAYDSLGNEVDASKILRSMTVTVMSGSGVNAMQDASVTEDSTSLKNISGVEKYVFTELQSKSIRPDIYEMTYTFTDDYGYTATATRKVVCIWEFGDVNLSKVVDGTDNTVLTRIIKGLLDPVTGIKTTTSNLYHYRIIDINLSNVVDGTDNTVLTRIIKGLVSQDKLYNAIQ